MVSDRLSSVGQKILLFVGLPLLLNVKKMVLNVILHWTIICRFSSATFILYPIIYNNIDDKRLSRLGIDFPGVGNLL